MKALFVTVLVLASSQAMARGGNVVNLDAGSGAYINVDSPTYVTCAGSSANSNAPRCAVERNRSGYYDVVVTEEGQKKTVVTYTSMSLAIAGVKELREAGLCQ